MNCLGPLAPSLSERYFNVEGAMQTDEERLKSGILPKHVAFIMDGNGRWAQKKGLSRLVGHDSGTRTIKKIVMESKRLGIPYVTFYAFSTENWKRPVEEVEGLMRLIVKFVNSEIREIDENNIKINLLGHPEGLPSYAREAILKAIDITKNNDGMAFNIALNYGGRDEILTAVKEIAKAVQSGEMQIEDINESAFEKHLFTAGMPDPDVLIRTSGEQRLSNFLPWQLVYAELIFDPIHWPDFDEKAYHKALLTFMDRNRRFGGI
jgi:undecaprenyl diphosphate synthase